MPIRQITIIGTGLIGGSFAMALKKHHFLGRIVGCDRAPVLERARDKGAIDEGRTSPSDAIRGSQLVLLATPVGSIIDLIERIGPVLSARTLLTDVCSTKAGVVARAEAILERNAACRFLAEHPMSRQEQSGVEFTDTALFV